MIWCVEDDAAIRDIEIYALQSVGFETKAFADGLSFWEALQTEQPELVILDIMLPGMNGMELLEKMKQSPRFCSIPVIMASAKGQEHDKIKGLNLGADDYLVKPFGIMEMIARVKAVLRRCRGTGKKNLESGDLLVNIDERSVFVKGEKIALTHKEFELLRTLLSHPGLVYTREMLFARVWNTDYIGESRTLDMHIRGLRQKLRGCAKIETIRHVGYKWEETHDT